MIDIETAMNGLLEYEKDIVKRDRERSLLEYRSTLISRPGYRIDEFERFIREDYFSWMNTTYYKEEFKSYIHLHPHCLSDIYASVKENKKDFESIISDIIKIDGIGAVLATGMVALIDPNRYGIINNSVLHQLRKYGMVSVKHTVASECGIDEIIKMENALGQIAMHFNSVFPHHKWNPRMVDKALWGLEKLETK
ncbi:MAG: hypothetical protein IJ535_02205 [Pseudobutyrivibrio sp.]|uniref:hypothetical protein n=1 Tax=Pseudobutyrivibrio sp. TaxID=2014367 RepID=UPI0025F69F24|nr:hypothetical protein [Pseudobutyrivibrio sp.]MBQ8488572.1 hypothetical protein [Pseudobutyrivibrio sp.]